MKPILFLLAILILTGAGCREEKQDISEQKSESIIKVLPASTEIEYTKEYPAKEYIDKNMTCGYSFSFNDGRLGIIGCPKVTTIQDLMDRIEALESKVK